MDSELLTDEKTDNILTYRLPLVIDVLLHIRCASFAYENDPVLCLMKKKIAKELVYTRDILPLNIPLSGLQFMLRALYFACTTPKEPQENLSCLYAKTVDEWLRLVYHNVNENDEKTVIVKLIDKFAYIYSYICFRPKDFEEECKKICPYCIIDQTFCDIGWTDLVCPQLREDLFDSQDFFAKRGNDKNFPDGFCRHMLSFHNTLFDTILFHETNLK